MSLQQIQETVRSEAHDAAGHGVAYPVSVGTRLGTAHYERLAQMAADWGVKPSVLARVLIIQGLRDFAAQPEQIA